MSYLTLDFAPNRDCILVEKIPEALEIVKDNKYKVIPEVVKFSDLEVLGDGSLEVGGRVSKSTRRAIDDICRIVGVPLGFAAKIPVDLLLTNIKKLKQGKLGQELAVLRRPDGVVAGVVKAPYNEVSYEDFLTGLLHFDSKYVDITESMVTVCIAFEKSFGLRPEDPFYVGSYCYNSIIGTRPLHLESGFFRSECSNSYVMPYGKIKADYRLPVGQRLERFTSLVTGFRQDLVERIESRFHIFENRTLFKHELSNIWYKLNTVVGQSEADHLLGFSTSEERKRLLQEVSIWQSKNNQARLLGTAVEEPLLTSVPAYDVINSVTDLAKRYHEIKRWELEKLGGTLIHKIILN
jgi:hypothetical protein